jgi:hypothetical protein
MTTQFVITHIVLVIAMLRLGMRLRFKLVHLLRQVQKRVALSVELKGQLMRTIVG